MRALARFWTQHRLLSLAFLAALLVTGAFVWRLAVHMPQFAGPATDPAIAGWMTPKLVSRGWHLPPEVLDGALGIEPGEGRTITMAQIAARNGESLAVIEARIEAAAAEWRKLHPELPP